MDHSLLGSSVHGILQARILEWVAIPFSRGSSRPRDRSRVFSLSCTGRRNSRGNAGDAKAGDAGDPGSTPGSRRSPGGGHGNPLQYAFLENPMDRGAWWATVHGVAKSWTWLKWLNTCVYMSILISQFIPSSPLPVVSTNPFFMSVSLFLPYK